MTEEAYRKHLESVAAGPRTESEIAAAERLYKGRIDQGRAELAAAAYSARRAPGAPPVSMIAALKASAPFFKHDISTLPEIIAEEADDNEPVTETSYANGKVEPSSSTREVPLDREMLQALGKLFVEVKKQRGRGEAWEEIVDALMLNLHRLAPGWGTIKDIIGLARSLDEYSNPVAAGATKKQDRTALYRKALLMDDGDS